MARGVNLLHPKVQPYAEKLVEECKRKGLNIQITDTLRSESEQNALYARGRTKAGSIVTNAKYPCSNHNWGIAFDFCRADGQGAYNDNDGFFAKVGAVGKSIGLSWGGDWTSFKDKPHFEYTGFGTWKALKSKYGTPEKFLGTAMPTAGTTAAGSLLKQGSRGEAVGELQTRLNELGYSCGAADGIFGARTLEAVKAFQKAQGLTVDGIAGDKTRAALAAAKPKTEAAAQTAAAKGSDTVKEYQTELNKQFGAGLAADGIWGPETEAATVNVKKGAKGELTRLLQRLLTAKGYPCGDIDGIFGVNTEAAVRKFQKAEGLTADGIAGKKTWKALLD